MNLINLLWELMKNLGGFIYFDVPAMLIFFTLLVGVLGPVFAFAFCIRQRLITGLKSIPRAERVGDAFLLLGVLALFAPYSPHEELYRSPSYLQLHLSPLSFTALGAILKWQSVELRANEVPVLEDEAARN